MDLFDTAVAEAKRARLLLEKKEFFRENTGELIGEGARKAKVIGAPENNNLIIWGSGCVCNTSVIRISGTGNLVVIGPGARFTDSTVTLLGSNCIFWFGALSTVGSLTVQIASETKFVIGDECMLSTRIMADTTDHHAIYDMSTGDRINPVGSIHIENHVWLGRDVNLCKGAHIGTGSIVGQRSLVNGGACIEPHSLYAGVPARKIRSGVTWSRMSASTYVEMENTHRHAEYVRKRETLRSRCFSFSAD